MSPLYNGLGLTVGAIQSDMDSGERQDIYGRDITYGTNNEFGFDYLRDNMKPLEGSCRRRVRSTTRSSTRSTRSSSTRPGPP